MAYTLVDDAPTKGSYTLIDEEPKQPGINDRGGMLQNIAGGILSGAGQIGSTIMAPIDMVARSPFKQALNLVPGGSALLQADKMLGGNTLIGRDDRRAAMDQALTTAGVNTDSGAFKTGKIGTEIAGTLGVGGAIAKPVQALAATRWATGMEPLTEGIVKGLQTGGFRIGELANAGRGVNAATRAITGAVTGGATAGYVNPDDAKIGAMIGGALPLTTQLGGAIGRAIRPNNQITPQKMELARQAVDSGFVVPPADLDPNAATELLSGLSGKIKTAQVASQKNQPVVNNMAKKALGVAPDEVITPELLQGIRTRAGQAYNPVKQSGMVKADSIFNSALDDIAETYKGANSAFPGIAKNEVGDLVQSLKVGEFDAAGGVEALKVLRETADKAFRTGDTGLGKASKAAATALESQLERHLVNVGDPAALQALRDARKLIAKTYTVQKGLNGATGDVSAPALAKLLEKGKPLEGELLTIAKTAQAFPKSMQLLKEAPKAVSPLDWFGATVGSAATGNVLPMLGIGARPLARSYLLSPAAQRAATRIPGLLAQPEELGLLTNASVKTAPLLGRD